jgi:hypothetical protein
MRSAIVARVRDRNPMEGAHALGHRFWRLLPYGRRYVQNVPVELRPDVWPVDRQRSAPLQDHGAWIILGGD